MPKVSGYRKAIAGGAVAAATWFATAWTGEGIDAKQVGVLPLAILTGAGIVAMVKNSNGE